MANVTMTYMLDWPADEWVELGITSSLILDTMARVSEEFREAWALATMVKTSTTAHNQHNVIKVLIVLTLREQDMSYLLLKYPQGKRSIPLDD